MRFSKTSAKLCLKKCPMVFYVTECVKCMSAVCERNRSQTISVLFYYTRRPCANFAERFLYNTVLKNRLSFKNTKGSCVLDGKLNERIEQKNNRKLFFVLTLQTEFHFWWREMSSTRAINTPDLKRQFEL